MGSLKFNAVMDCGVLDRVAYRLNDTCYIGCFTGSRLEIIDAITKKYVGVLRVEYVSKITELFKNVILNYKEVELITGVVWD